MSDLQRYQWRSTSPMSHGIFKSDVGTYVKYEDARKRIEELEAALKVEVTKNTIDSVVHGELQRKLAASQGEVSFKDTRIEELESELKSLHGSFNAATKYIPKYEAVVEKLEAWCDFYTKGLHPDDAQTLYIDSLYFLEEDDDE